MLSRIFFRVLIYVRNVLKIVDKSRRHRKKGMKKQKIQNINLNEFLPQT